MTSWKAAMTQEGGCSVRGGVWKMGLAFKMSALGQWDLDINGEILISL